MSNVHLGVHNAMTMGANPSIMMIEDSWSWYPLDLDNLTNEISGSGALPSQTFLLVGRTGQEVIDWSGRHRKEIDLAFKIYGDGGSELLLSGGGNDIAGRSDFLWIIREGCSKDKEIQGCYREG